MESIGSIGLLGSEVGLLVSNRTYLHHHTLYSKHPSSFTYVHRTRDVVNRFICSLYPTISLQPASSINQTPYSTPILLNIPCQTPIAKQPKHTAIHHTYLRPTHTTPATAAALWSPGTWHSRPWAGEPRLPEQTMRAVGVPQTPSRSIVDKLEVCCSSGIRWVGQK